MPILLGHHACVDGVQGLNLTALPTFVTYQLRHVSSQVSGRDVANIFPMFDVKQKPLFHQVDTSSEAGIFQTIKSIYAIAKFSPECLVISLLYIERLRSITGILLLTSNWQPILLAAMVVAQKVWDDSSLLNVDFTMICSAYTLKDINSLEKRFLELLEFNVSITASLYASYYFELRTLCEKSERPFTLKPLGDEERRRLEQRSLAFKDELHKQRRWRSGPADIVSR